MLFELGVTAIVATRAAAAVGETDQAWHAGRGGLEAGCDRLRRTGAEHEAGRRRRCCAAGRVLEAHGNVIAYGRFGRSAPGRPRRPSRPRRPAFLRGLIDVPSSTAAR
jgi:hypothetical protein